MTLQSVHPEFRKQVKGVTQRIAPLWPLKHFVAVNPFVGLTDQPFSEACQTVKQVVHASMLMPREYYAQQVQQGRIQEQDLQKAALEHGLDVVTLKHALAQPSSQNQAVVAHTVTEVVDEARNTFYSRMTTEEISKWCAAYFDQTQAVWTLPWRDLPLYSAWRMAARLDRQPEVLGFRDFRKWVGQLPTDPHEAIHFITEALQVRDAALEVYLHRALCSISGWASYVRYQTWDAELAGVEKDDLVQLLAIRLSFDFALFQMHKNLQLEWNRAVFQMGHLRQYQTDMQGDLALQRAFEHGFQRELISQLSQKKEVAEQGRKAVQAVFCIDVRSEVFRRSLETLSPDLETAGFAGFFGLPIQYVSLAEEEGSAQCPVLLHPALSVQETLQGVSEKQRKEAISARVLRKQAAQVWKAFKTSAVSSFAYVETAGLGFGAKLASDSFRITRPVKHPSVHGLHHHQVKQLGPDLSGWSLEQRLKLAEGMLKGMSMKTGFARLILLAGHGSSTVNNPHASGLDCGACGGHTGEANARVAAKILNDAAVRVGLAAKGIDIPADSWFVAGLHNTTTDDMTLYDTEKLPASHQKDLQQLEGWLEQAAGLTRLSRAKWLGGSDKTALQMAQEVEKRSKDWSQVRPEWGLAGNAAFIAAPRVRTSSLNLEGRVFLHNYNWQEDPAFSVLELIMTAPMVVASWINLQYYGSTVDNRAFGSGNKVLHNVVGGTLGVLQGSRGDLQTGLPLQSLHDGEQFVHEPLRLSVFIEAPQEEINKVISKHGHVRDLLDHHWLYLFRITPEGEFKRYVGDLRWEALDS
ncbi:YbcC family protein [Deinococcus cellulosilyticus]|uniref:Probable inorganic carbon transporter subunit DabA n=1 Tax=Deinococcus cellulosilyticus (strain DSM 18568 / NBRC 106333 / KACC 11606 / 5516J-15) TaxID=1223518 RepID=A0A511N9N8_DEIC1|nr:DUF2309 domain-containing protein [Deinococcus cellulosilyticus]GEM49510.1 UPF0753 protein [Deinococcus cellulosilyticus NBRC 106333 = KACC 11606]